MDALEAQNPTEEPKSVDHDSWGGSAAGSSVDNSASAESSNAASSSAWGDGGRADGDESNAISSNELDSGEQVSSDWGESSADAQGEHATMMNADQGWKRETEHSLADASSNSANDSENQTSTDPKPATEDKVSSSHQSTAAGNDGWSISEDGILRGMKEGKGRGASWADIASALRRSKSQVKARWGIIKERQPPTSGEETTEPEATTEAELTTEAETTSGGDQIDGNASGAEDKDVQDATGSTQEVVDDRCQDKGKDVVVGDEEEEEEEEKRKSKQVRKKEVAKSRWHKGARNNKVAAENKQAKSKAHQDLAPALSGEEASSESSTSSPSSSSSLASFGYGHEEWHRQMRYLQDHMYASLYPPEIRPEPDAHFSARDCRLLAVLDSKQKRSRWLAMQADFYNVTGRMVPLDVLQDKCERAEAERERTGIERWVDDVSQQTKNGGADG